MNSSTFLSTLALGVALLSPAVGAQEPESEQLKVFLQGNSAASLRLLVEDAGGTVTHDLHIVDAVGAEMTRQQLNKVLESKQVLRYFDDLAVKDEPEEQPGETGQDCDVGGSVALDIRDSSIGWKLFNKSTEPARLEQLELNWPAQLGKTRKITLGKTELAPSRYADSSAGSAEIRADGLERALLALDGAQVLQVEFTSPAAQVLHQREFRAKATFSGACTTELIPGYDDNHENFHYTSVVGADSLHLNGITGKGVTVAVLDSGLWNDPALVNDTHGKPRILARYDAIADTTGNEVFDASGHGTHMTSVIAHNGETLHEGKPTGGYKGVAPDVSLVAVKAFDTAGQGDFLDIVRAIQWVVDNRQTYDIRVLNLSFAARPRWPYWLDPIGQAAMRAWESGITVVAAAGNEGPEAMTIGSPGNVPFVITVGAVTDSWTPDTKDDDYIPDFSSRGPTPSAHIKPDLVAPGGHITGLTRPWSSLTRDHPDYILPTGELVMTGSSQATALVSGVVALLLQLEPDLTPDDVKCKLMSSAEPAINRDGLLAYSPFQQGHGYVSAPRAVTLGHRGCGNPGLDIHREIAGEEQSSGPAILDENGAASLPGLANMVSPLPAEKGYSDTRKWGVKAHIERQPPLPAAARDGDSPPPFDWMGVYLRERETIEQLSNPEPR